MKPTYDEICKAACEGNLPLLRELAHRGADLNEVNSSGDTLLDDVLTDLCIEERPYRYDVARALLELGADPNVLSEGRSSPMLSPMFHMDTEMLRILLEAGADPNKPAGFLDAELFPNHADSFYDYAECDYRFNVYDFHLPDEPTDADRKDKESWLAYLDRMAIQHGVRRPDHLYLLRSYGAKSAVELQAGR